MAVASSSGSRVGRGIAGSREFPLNTRVVSHLRHRIAPRRKRQRARQALSGERALTHERSSSELNWWKRVSEHPLWAGLIATVVGGLLVLVIWSAFHGGTSNANSRPPVAGSKSPISSPSTTTPTTSASPTPSPTPTVTYSNVSFLVLCNAPGVSTQGLGLNGCSSSVERVGDHVENWDAQAFVSIEPVQVLAFPETTCRSLTLKSGFNDYIDGGPAPSLRITVAVAQGSAAPVSVNTKQDEVYTLFVKLDGGPWDISITTNLPGTWSTYLSGYASCSTSTGQ